MPASAPRTSYKYIGLRVRQHSAGTYAVVVDTDGSQWLVYHDPNANIGSTRRWRATRRDGGLEIVARTKDDIMRSLADSGMLGRRSA